MNNKIDIFLIAVLFIAIVSMIVCFSLDKRIQQQQEIITPDELSGLLIWSYFNWTLQNCEIVAWLDNGNKIYDCKLEEKEQ